MRIYELAKKNKCTSAEVKVVLDSLNIEYKAHTSAVPLDRIAEVEKALKTPASSKKQASTSKVKVVKKVTKKSSSSKEAKKEETTKKNVEKEKPTTKKVIKIKEITKKEQLSADSVKTKESANKKKIPVGTKSKSIEKDKVPQHIKENKTEESLLQSDEPVKIPSNTTVHELAELLNIESAVIIKKLFLLGVVANINKSLDKDSIYIVADELNIKVEIEEEVEEDEEEEEEEEDITEDLLEVRPPVVTVMGHVNHGKTTLLDVIRNTTVADGESGGITQHIGAYLVEHNGSKICFIDTPGHAAFTSMRSMGANITDIVILVVAANDGIQPQTLECISHAKEAEVPIIIAINKTDVDGVNIDQIKGELANNGVTPEDWGGDNLSVNISALKGIGINELLDAVNLQSELLELKANPKGRAFGIVIESCQTDKKGPVVTMLVKNGTFNIGDSIACGHVYGKIRRMENEHEQSIKKATPSMPVRIFGFSEVPNISAQVKAYKIDKEAKDIAKQRKNNLRHKNLQRKESITLENIYSSLQAEAKKDFKIIIKADVLGSIDALKSLLSEISSEKIKLKIIHAATGTVSDNDIIFANTYNAMIFAYKTKINSSAISLSKQHNVSIRNYDVIYHIHDDIKKGMEGLLEDEYIKNVVGKTIVKKKFRLGKGFLAGCLVTEGKVTNHSVCTIMRDGESLGIEEKVASLKHYKDEVKEVKMGIECGISLEKFNDFKENDVMEFFELVQTLSKL